MRPTSIGYFHLGDEIIATIDPMPEGPGLRDGEFIYLDKSYHVIEVAHDYSSQIDDGEDDIVSVHVHLAEES